jgi:hypothetical protein
MARVGPSARRVVPAFRAEQGRHQGPSVLHSFAAIESIANDSIGRLPEDAVVTIGKKNDTRDVPKADMARRLNLDEKLDLVVPPARYRRSDQGPTVMERYIHLKRLRDDLVHVKDRGVDPDRAVLTAYDRLLLGDADSCARNSFDLVQAARPGFLGARVVEHLSR